MILSPNVDWFANLFVQLLLNYPFSDMDTFFDVTKSFLNWNATKEEWQMCKRSKSLYTCWHPMHHNYVLCYVLCIMLALNITFQMTLFNVGTLADHDQRIVKLCDWIRPPVGEYKIKNRQGQAQSLNRGPLKFRWFCKLGQKDVHFDDGQNWKKFIDHFCCNNNNALENGECCWSLLWFIRYDSGSDHFWEQL